MKDEGSPDEDARPHRVARPAIDYQALFTVTPSPCMVLGPDLVLADINEAACRVTGRTRQDLLGRYLFDAFPENPADPDADGVRNLHASLHRVLRSKEPDTVAPMKYDIPVAGRPGVFQERWWSAINTPVLGPEGQVEWILHRGEDVTSFIRSHPRLRESGTLSDVEAMEVELYARARELKRLNEELRQAHARERQVALTLQEAMLHSPHLARHRETAVRYLPAAGSLNVCGDWYDVVDLPEDRFAVAVGDVVGHGLEAAAVMGMLRSALSAVVRAVEWPAEALDVLGLYARDVEGALSTTVVQAVVDTCARRIVYSSAATRPPSWSTPTAPSTFSTRPPTHRWEPAPNPSPTPRPPCPTPAVTPSCSTPTASSNAPARTSTTACDASPTRSAAMPAANPNASPTPCSRTSASAAVPATTSP